MSPLLRPFRSALTVLTALLFAATAHAQFLNYDFDGNTLEYFSYSSEGIGELDSTDNAYNTYLTSGVSAGEDLATLEYENIMVFDEDWSLDLTITAPTGMSGVTTLAAPEEINMGLHINKTGAVDSALMNLEFAEINPDGSGPNDRTFEWEYNDGFSGTNNTTNTVVSALTTFTFTFDYVYDGGAGTGLLSAYYNGVQIGSTFDLLNGSSGWNVDTENDTITVLLYGASAGIDEFDAPRPTFDNFTVTAVPEPSSYAALFGVIALGAGWRRRRRG